MTLGQVSGMLNLFRQIGGSVGIALVATMLSINSHQNYVDLTAKVSELNQSTQIQLQQTQNALSKKMTSDLGAASGREAALRTFAGRLQNQVFMLTFNQLMFYLIGLVMLGFIPLSMLRFRNRPAASAAADAH